MKNPTVAIVCGNQAEFDAFARMNPAIAGARNSFGFANIFRASRKIDVQGRTVTAIIEHRPPLSSEVLPYLRMRQSMVPK